MGNWSDSAFNFVPDQKAFGLTPEGKWDPNSEADKKMVGTTVDIAKNTPGTIDRANWTMPNADHWRDLADKGRVDYQNRALDQTRLNSIQDQQQQLAEMLRDRAMGKTPSLAEMQLKEGIDASQRTALGTARAAGPQVGAGMASYLAQKQQGALSGQGAADAAQLRAAEQAQAESALGQQLGQMGSTNLGQQSSIANMQGMNDNMVKYYTSVGMSIDEAQRQANIDMQKFMIEQYWTPLKIQANMDIAKIGQPEDPSIWPSALNAAGTLGAAYLSTSPGQPAQQYQNPYAQPPSWNEPEPILDTKGY